MTGPYSLIETAKASGLDPYGYLRHVFTELPKANCVEDIEALLPHRVEPDTLRVPAPRTSSTGLVERLPLLTTTSTSVVTPLFGALQNSAMATVRYTMVLATTSLPGSASRARRSRPM